MYRKYTRYVAYQDMKNEVGIRFQRDNELTIGHHTQTDLVLIHRFRAFNPFESSSTNTGVYPLIVSFNIFFEISLLVNVARGAGGRGAAGGGGRGAGGGGRGLK